MSDDSCMLHDPSQPLLQVDIITLFPSIFDGWLSQGVVSRAVDRGLVALRRVHLRPFGVGAHRMTDDYPFGGGAGMVMKPEPLFDAVESLHLDAGVPIILMSPAGDRFDQARARQLSLLPRLVMISGHYEGVDHRVRQSLITRELSIGDYVLSSGELATMVVVDAIVRLLPGAIAADSIREESFSDELLEYPHFTRPAEYRGLCVPDVLTSGNHQNIRRWRREQAIEMTWRRRPDLLERAMLTGEESKLVDEWRSGDARKE